MHKDIIVIGTSAGGIEALRLIFGALPKDLDASIFVVLHTSADSPGILGAIFDRAGVLPAITVKTQERIRPGTIYLASPDHHIILEPGLVRATRGPKENRFRPAVDPLFRSAAQTYGPRVIGVILTGGLDDGTAGLWAVKQLGGTAVVQNPDEALAGSMPRNAMKYVQVDHCVALAEVAPLLVQLTREPAQGKGADEVSKTIEIEINIAKEDRALDAGVLKLGEPSNYACPECHGVLLQMHEDRRIRFRCHTGHAYSVESLMAEINDAVQDALWNAIRSIEESALFMQHLSRHAGEAEKGGAADELRKAAEDATRRADLVRQAVLDHTAAHAVRVNPA